ncbi:GNAT family N-acetyltransferase [Sphingomonas quercus]|uniref:GNAT family N-acetyltransferase n=1 Tax=Sphingomonas quercus TaxID=2842451 RepID=A0ABS6BLF5_9SPHN|nr:GNAT family N-acetyltransferase [Sphingomonas quercus]MBU3079153.1 GNAT family N-acetyltransferase [Sphingomonas quercus]
MIVMNEAFDPAFGEAWTRAQCAGIMSLPGVWLTLASEGETPAGFSLARIVADEAELLLIGVRPGWRRRGIGRALLHATEIEAIARGAGKLHLEVRAENPAAALYVSAGFTPAGRRIGYYVGKDGQLFDAVTLSKSLDAI